jgi:DNA ligase 1
VDTSKGIALRFPRFIQVRTDKSTEEATNAEEIMDMYQAQSNKVSVKEDEKEDSD